MTKFTELHNRMDEDLNLYYLEKYLMMNQKTNKALEGVSNITLNDPRVFGDAAMSILSLDKRTFDIISIDPTIQAQLEKEIKNYFYLNDETLSEEMIEPLDDCLNFFALLRGWMGVLALMYQDKDKYLPTIKPLDPRWMEWEIGKKGLKWASYTVRMERAEVEEIYKVKLGDKKDTELNCRWDDKEFNIFQSENGKSSELPLKTITHNLGFCPVIITPVPTQPLLISSGTSSSGTTIDALSRQGESIYAPVRTLVPAMNEVASIWATINKQQFATPMVYTGGRDLKETNIFGFGIIVQINPGEKLEAMQLRDMTPSAQALFGQLFARWERATMSSVNFGQLSFEASALAVADLKSDRDKVIVPRRRGKSTMYRKIIKALQRQIKDKCYKTDIDEGIEIDKTLWENKFMVSIAFDSISPQENIANAQLASQWKNLGMSMEWVLRNIAKVDDPEGTLRQAKLERLYNILPTLELADSAIGLAPGEVTEEKINQMKAKLIMKALEDQLKSQAQLNQPTNQPSQPKQNITVGRASSEKLAAAQAERTGQAAIQKGTQAKFLGGQGG